MEVENLALAVVIERHDILAVGKVSVFVLVPVPAHQADGIELADKVVRKFLPVSHHPSFRLFWGWGQFDSYRRVGENAGREAEAEDVGATSRPLFALIYIKKVRRKGISLETFSYLCTR